MSGAQAGDLSSITSTPSSIFDGQRPTNSASSRTDDRCVLERTNSSNRNSRTSSASAFDRTFRIFLGISIEGAFYFFDDRFFDFAAAKSAKKLTFRFRLFSGVSRQQHVFRVEFINRWRVSVGVKQLDRTTGVLFEPLRFVRKIGDFVDFVGRRFARCPAAQGRQDLHRHRRSAPWQSADKHVISRIHSFSCSNRHHSPPTSDETPRTSLP